MCRDQCIFESLERHPQLSLATRGQVRKYKSMILEDLESALAEHAPAPQEVNSELPPLTIDGIPVSVAWLASAPLSPSLWT